MKNDLSVWTYPYGARYYFTHPHKLIKETYHNFKNWWHRGRYGFAYIDVWDWGSWWVKVGAKALRYMAEHASGYPGIEPWETPEKWEAHLYKVADDLEWCAKNFDWDEHEKVNEYYKEFNEILSHAHRESLTDDGDKYRWYEFTPEEEIIRKKYWNKEKEITEREDNERAEILAGIGRNLGRYFD